MLFSWCIGVLVYEARRRGKKYYNSMVYKAYAEVAINTQSSSCPHCGTTEMLCGHNGVGCVRSKQFIVYATPNLDTWEEQDRWDHYSSLIEGEDGVKRLIYQCENAENEEEALDEFHYTIPIACLDDWEFEVDYKEE